MFALHFVVKILSDQFRVSGVPWTRYTTKNVIVYEKTRHMGFSMKSEFDAYLTSSTIELTRVQVLDPSRASLWSYSAFLAIAPHPQQSRNYGLKAFLCTRMAFPYTTRIPELN